MPRLFLALALLLLAAPLRAQTDGLLTIDGPLQTFLERQQTRGLIPEAVLAHRPLSADEARPYLDRLAAHPEALSSTDRRLLARFRGEVPGPNVERLQGLFPFLYTDGQTYLSTEGDGYGLQLEPLLYLAAGPVQQSNEAGTDEGITGWRNTRGVRAAGHFGRRDAIHLFFETRVEENQRLDPAADRPVVNARLGERYYREDGTFDYWVVTGMAGLRTKFVEARFGRSRNHWGPGQGSLLVSDYGTTYDQLQLRTRVWRLEYVNIFSALADRSVPRDSVTRQYRARYGVFHRLAVHLPGRVQIGLSESAMVAPTPEDRGPEFYFTYLNPIIFLRAADFEWGSPANMLIAADAQWVALDGVKLYGQFMLDEFRASELFSGDGWVNNKWGALAGFHVAGLGLKDLDIRGEWARVRPYTYASVDAERAYLNGSAYLGHAYGPNAESAAVWASYRPTDRITASAFASVARRGRNEIVDGELVNWGGDPVVPYTVGAPNEYGNTVGQGVRLTETRLEGRLSYELLPGLEAELLARYGRLTDEKDATADRTYTGLYATLRWGLPFQAVRF